MKCPRCNQLIDSQALSCPHCQALLKAYGHPGIPLHQATGEAFLCDRCTYHEDDTCTFPQRPYAKTCSLYHDKFEPPEIPFYSSHQPGGFSKTLRGWLQRHRGLLILLGAIAISFLLALLK